MQLSIEEQSEVIEKIDFERWFRSNSWEDQKSGVYLDGAEDAPAHFRAVVAALDPIFERCFNEIARLELKLIEIFRATDKDKHEHRNECRRVDSIAKILARDLARNQNMTCPASPGSTSSEEASASS